MEKKLLMINDDKPLLRFWPDGVYAYGTPWDGKHHLNTDIRLKVKGNMYPGTGMQRMRSEKVSFSVRPMMLFWNQSFHAC